MGGSKIIMGTRRDSLPVDVAVNDGGKLVCIDYDHELIHTQKRFIFGYAALLGLGGTLVLWMKTAAAKYTHAFFRVESSGGCAVQLHEASTKTYNAGNALTAFNRVRSSTKTPSLQQACHTPGGAETGTALPAWRTGGFKSPGSSRSDEEWVLKPDTAYCLTITSDGAGNSVTGEVDFYEEDELHVTG
jgi:hypothetical protein